MKGFFSEYVFVYYRSGTEERKIALRTARGDLNIDLGPKSFTSVVFSMTQTPSINVMQ